MSSGYYKAELRKLRKKNKILKNENEFVTSFGFTLLLVGMSPPM